MHVWQYRKVYSRGREWIDAKVKTSTPALTLDNQAVELEITGRPHTHQETLVLKMSTAEARALVNRLRNSLGDNVL